MRTGIDVYHLKLKIVGKSWSVYWGGRVTLVQKKVKLPKQLDFIFFSKKY